MPKTLSLLQLSSAMATHAANRHAVISENIANADTPGYKTKTLKPFADIYRESMAGMGEGVQGNGFGTLPAADSASVDPNGNSVSLEEQMMQSSQAQNDHALALMIFRKSLNMMRIAVGKNA